MDFGPKAGGDLRFAEMSKIPWHGAIELSMVQRHHIVSSDKGTQSLGSK